MSFWNELKRQLYKLYKLIRVKDLDQFENVAVDRAGRRRQKRKNTRVPIMTCKMEKRIIVLFRCVLACQWFLGRYTQRANLLSQHSFKLFAFCLLRFRWIYIYSDSLEEKIILRYYACSFALFVLPHGNEIIECELQMEWLNLSYCRVFWNLWVIWLFWSNTHTISLSLSPCIIACIHFFILFTANLTVASVLSKKNFPYCFFLAFGVTLNEYTKCSTYFDGQKEKLEAPIKVALVIENSLYTLGIFSSFLFLFLLFILKFNPPIFSHLSYTQHTHTRMYINLIKFVWSVQNNHLVNFVMGCHNFYASHFIYLITHTVKIKSKNFRTLTDTQ